MDDLSVGDLRRLARVGECGSFSAAARALGETPKQVSRRVARIEEQLGVRLFHRTTRRLSVTAEGEAWIRAARVSLSALEQTRSELADGPVGQVRVQMLSRLLDPFVDWLADALGDYPGLEIDLRVGDVVDDWAGAGLDVLVTAMPPEHPGLVVRKLAAIEPVLAAHPEYVRRYGAPTSVDELAGRAGLRFGDEGAWTLVAPDGRERVVPVGGRFRSTDSRALARALHHGCGIGLATRRELLESGLVRVLPDWRFRDFQLYLVMAPGRRRLARVRVVVRAIEALFVAL